MTSSIIKTLSEEYDIFWNKVKNNDNFVFLRYGDGEKALMCAEKVHSQEGWEAPEKLTILGCKLYDTLFFLDSKVWYGISCPCCDSRAYFWYLQHIKSNNITFANIWININYQKFKKDFMELQRDAVVIANYRAENKTIGKLNVLKQYSVDDDCIGFWNREGKQFIRKIIFDTISFKNILFVVSAGPLSEIIIAELYKNNPDNCYIDFGSALDFLIHEKITRPFMIENNALSMKNCWMYKKIEIDVDVVLSMYKRPECLRKQIDAIKKQTLTPKHIYLYQDGIDSYYKIELDKEIIKEFDNVMISNDNNGVWNRFEYARDISTSTYVCIFDDDTIPGEKWLENCFVQMQKQEGVYGTNGILLSEKNEYPWGSDDIRVGWNNPNSESVKVDFVGHSWFLKTEWLNYMFDSTNMIRNKYKYVGEDMSLSYGCFLHGIDTYVPPHPYDNPELWGSLPGYAKKYGTSDSAVSLNSCNHRKMNELLIKLRKSGWINIFERDRELYDQFIIQFKNKSIKYEQILKKICKLWNEKKEVFLYGAGNFGKLFFDYFKQNNLMVKGFVVSDINLNDNIEYQNIPIIGIKEFVKCTEERIVILSLSEFFHDEIKEQLKIYKNLRIFPSEEDAIVYEDIIKALKIFSIV